MVACVAELYKLVDKWSQSWIREIILEGSTDHSYYGKILQEKILKSPFQFSYIAELAPFTPRDKLDLLETSR
jgi:hypothetical protein